MDTWRRSQPCRKCDRAERKSLKIKSVSTLLVKYSEQSNLHKIRPMTSFLCNSQFYFQVKRIRNNIHIFSSYNILINLIDGIKICLVPETGRFRASHLVVTQRIFPRIFNRVVNVPFLILESVYWIPFNSNENVPESRQVKACNPNIIPSHPHTKSNVFDETRIPENKCVKVSYSSRQQKLTK